MAIIQRNHKILDNTPTQNVTTEVSFPLVKTALSAADVVKLLAGAEIEFEGVGTFTDTNSTDTAIVRVRFGNVATTLSSRAVVAAGSAFDAADNNFVHVRGKIVLQSVGPTGKFHSIGAELHSGGSLTEVPLYDQSIDTTLPIELGPTVQWSVAHAENLLTWKWFNVRIIDARELS